MIEPYLRDLARAFLRLPDPRRKQGTRHKLPALLLAYTAALLCQCLHTAAAVEWLKHHAEHLDAFGLDHGAPSESTYCRLFAALDSKRFAKAIGRAVRAWLKLGAQLAMDGKTCRAAHVGEDGKPVHILAFVAAHSYECLQAVPVGKKQNEASAAQKLLPTLLHEHPSVATVTGDALFLQRKICLAIRKAQKHYLIKLKANQKTQLTEAQRLLGRKRTPQYAFVQKNHGRIETYAVFATNEIQGWFDWPGLKSVLRVEKHTQWMRRGKLVKQTVTNHYALTSLPADAPTLFSIYLGHWSIETSFAIKDNALMEDRHAVRSPVTALILSRLRATVVSILAYCRGKDGFAKTLRAFARDPAPIWRALVNPNP